MLENRHRGALKFTDQVGGRGDVQDVVVAKRLALELLKMVVERAIQGSLLVRVFSVAQLLGLG